MPPLTPFALLPADAGLCPAGGGAATRAIGDDDNDDGVIWPLLFPLLLLPLVLMLVPPPELLLLPLSFGAAGRPPLPPVAAIEVVVVVVVVVTTAGGNSGPLGGRLLPALACLLAGTWARGLGRTSGRVEVAIAELQQQPNGATWTQELQGNDYRESRAIARHFGRNCLIRLVLRNNSCVDILSNTSQIDSLDRAGCTLQ